MASCSEILMAMVDRDHHGRTVTSHGRDFSTPRFGPFFKHVSKEMPWFLAYHV